MNGHTTPGGKARAAMTPKLRVMKEWPKAYRVPYAGAWHIYTGDTETGNTCIGSGDTPTKAWADAEINL